LRCSVICLKQAFKALAQKKRPISEALILECVAGTEHGLCALDWVRDPVPVISS